MQGDIKDIRGEMKGIHADVTAVDSRTAVINLGVRVSKLEGNV